MAVTQAKKNWALPFFTIWAGQAVSLLGSQLVQFALVWWLTQETGSATVLATATLVALLPQVLIGPFAGVLVDRWSRRVVLIVADTLTALAVLVLAALFWSGTIQIWHIYGLMFFRAVAGIFHWTAMQASTSLMVPKEHLARVQGLNQMLHGLMNIGTAPLAALLIGILPMQSVLAIDVVTAMIAVLPLFFIAIPRPLRTDIIAQGSGMLASLFGDLKAGFTYVWRWPALMMILVMATLINLVLTPVGALQPLLVTNHFGGGALQLAWMEAAWGIGVVVGGITLSVWGGFKRRILTSMLGLLLLGLPVLLVGLLPPGLLWVAVGAFFVIGFSNPFVNGPLFAVVQSIVAPQMQGRVFTLISSFAAAMAPLGLLAAGPLADRYGTPTWYIVGGILTAMLGLGALMIPAIMNIERDRPPHSAEDEPDAAQELPEALPAAAACD